MAGGFTGNGMLDLPVADLGTDPAYNGTVSILLGNGDGTFRPPVTYAVGLSGLFAIVAGDFTGDGRIDLAVDGGGGEAAVLLGNGDGTFQPATAFASGGVGPMAAGDFTGNGRDDLAVTYGNVVSVLLSNSDGTFQNPVNYVGGGEWAIVTGDFTGDGRIDLALANYSGKDVLILLGNGDGTFQKPVTYVVSAGPGALVTGDFTSDGRADLAVAMYSTNDVSVLLGGNDGTFTDPGDVADTPFDTPVVADVTGDGTADVLVVDGSGNILYRQAIPGQPGTFEPPVIVNPPLADGTNPYASRDIAWMPNTDQGPVLASVDADHDAVSLYAYRDGAFVRVGGFATGQRPAQIIAADLNGDGLTDLVVRNAGDGTRSVYLGSRLLGPISPLESPVPVHGTADHPRRSGRVRR